MANKELPDCNGASLRKANRRLTQLYDSVLAPCGLTICQFSILVNMENLGSPAMSDLAQALVLDRSALAHSLKPLERDGYVQQRKNESDGRSRLITLTPAGREKLVESNERWQKAQACFEATYGEEQARQLRALLSIIFSDNFADSFNAKLTK